MSLGNKLMALGQWFEKHFPERMTAAEVNQKIVELQIENSSARLRHQATDVVVQELVQRVAELEKRNETLNSDITKTKVMLLTQRQLGR